MILLLSMFWQNIKARPILGYRCNWPVIWLKSRSTTQVGGQVSYVRYRLLFQLYVITARPIGQCRMGSPQ